MLRRWNSRGSSARDRTDVVSALSVQPAVAGHQGESAPDWLRPAVFGVMDGLVSNVSLIAGVDGGGAGRDALVLAGLAGLVAGGFSMATGEYTSVRTEGEATESQIGAVVKRLASDPGATQAMLSSSFERRGVRPEVADAVAEDLSADPEEALRSHACELLGVDPTNLARPWVAAVSSFFSFAFGAVIPLLPYLLGWTSLVASLVLSALALLAVGALVSRLTGRPALYSGARQLGLGALSAGATYLIGSLIGASI